MRRERKWFVDAWAVRDGKLFASWRLPDTTTNYLSTATSTVFISVPDRQPIPIGRITTALRATRSGFQDRLRAANGAEIPFDDLKQVRDLLRRGYLGGGLGPASPTALGGPGPAPVVDGGAGAAHLENVADEPWSDGDGHMPTSAPRALDTLVDEVATATLLQWDEILGASPEADSAAALRRFWSFAHRLLWAGTPRSNDPFSALTAMRESASHYGARHVESAIAEMSDDLISWRYTFDPSLNQVSRGLVSMAPLPPLGRWDRRLNRLAEMAVLPVIDRRFWSVERTALDIAPHILTERLKGAPVVGQVRNERPPSVRVFDEVRPSWERTALPEDAELALEGFFDRCLSDTPTNDGPSGGVPEKREAVAELGDNWNIAREETGPRWNLVEAEPIGENRLHRDGHGEAPGKTREEPNQTLGHS